MTTTLTPADIAGIGMTSQRTRNRLMQRLREQGISNARVLSTMSTVPRHLFVDEAMATRAYEDVALPIGEGQTISQPYVVARMTEMVLAHPDVNRVLEIGTGSGYQAAVLSRLVETVFTVERIRSLLLRAKKRFQALGYNNIHAKHTDGSGGWSGHGPFDCIILTAAAATVPESLLAQLAPGGHMILPLGDQAQHQTLTVINNTPQGYQKTAYNDVKFVPFLPGKS